MGEARQFPRKNQSLTAQIKPLSSAESPWDVVTLKDLSAGGILFSYEKKGLAVGMRLRVVLHFPQALEHPLEAEVEIVRLQLAKAVQMVGARFTRIQDKDRSLIDAYIRGRT